ncbi:MAG: cell division protein ZapA [Hyphomicrobiaceae bacterium]|nr:cell division protein ZapA [Hyphomicrobiaceae bacterium]
MGQVTITLNGRAYRLSCRDDEEERLGQLVEHVRAKVEQLTGEFGQIGNERLMLMSALLIADELFEARDVREVAPSRKSKS